MVPPGKLRVILIQPSKYAEDGFVQRFRRGAVPASTLSYIYSMTLDYMRETGAEIELIAVDERVETNLDYLYLLKHQGMKTLVALVGVQSHQFQRALDIAAFAFQSEAQAVVGGPHPMTCDTAILHDRGVSFAMAEADLVWNDILDDAARGPLAPVYGRTRRWQRNLTAPVIRPPSREQLHRYIIPILGIYPARGCPFQCRFCSVVKISGRNIRSQPLDTTMESLSRAERAGVKLIGFTSDNFNKIPDVRLLLQTMKTAGLKLRFFAQCDSQIGTRDRDLIPLLAEAGCFQIFVGVESFNRKALLRARKPQNRPDLYADIVRLCRQHHIGVHLSNIIGFPGETESDILDHLKTLKALNPTQASFYILTPIPGTELYDEFRSERLIFERNLDRYDLTCETWSHDVLPRGRLTNALYRCYRRFYSSPVVLKRAATGRYTREDIPIAWYTKWSVYKRAHPMSGGVWRITLDHVDEYLNRRRQVFGVDLVPLPDSLPLLPADAALPVKRESNHGFHQSLPQFIPM